MAHRTLRRKVTFQPGPASRSSTHKPTQALLQGGPLTLEYLLLSSSGIIFSTA